MLSWSLWRDEGATFAEITQPTVQKMLGSMYLSDLSPPAYYLVERFWISFAGTGEVALRVPSLVFGLLAIAATYAAGRRAGSQLVAIVAGCIVAIAPLSVHVGMEARAYGMALFLSSFTILAFVCTAQARTRGWRVAWATCLALSGSLLILTHFTGLVVVGAELFAAVVLWLRRKTPNSVALAFGAFAALTLSAPALASLRDALSVRHAPIASNVLSSVVHDDIYLSGLYLSPFNGIAPAALLTMAVAAIVWLVTALRRGFDRRDWYTALFIWIAVAGLFTNVVQNVSGSRHLLAYSPAAWLATAMMLERFIAWLREPVSGVVSLTRIVSGVLIGVVVATGLWQLPAFVFDDLHPQPAGRELVAAVRATMRGPVLLVALPDYLGPTLNYYTRGDPRISLRGVANWSEPQFFHLNESQWSEPGFPERIASRILTAGDAMHATIIVAQDTHLGVSNGINYERAHEVLVAIERRRHVTFGQRFATSVPAYYETMRLVFVGKRNLTATSHPPRESGQGEGTRHSAP